MTDRSHFAAAANRLDRFLRDVKEAQFDAAGVKERPVTSPEPADAPDSAWRQRFAARSVQSGPAAAPPMPDLTAVAPGRPAPPPLRVPGAPSIGAVLGKPAKKRGRLGRLFGRGKH